MKFSASCKLTLCSLPVADANTRPRRDNPICSHLVCEASVRDHGESVEWQKWAPVKLAFCPPPRLPETPSVQVPSQRFSRITHARSLVLYGVGWYPEFLLVAVVFCSLSQSEIVRSGIKIYHDAVAFGKIGMPSSFTECCSVLFAVA